MNTIRSILIMFLACSFGLMVIAIVMVIMGLAGAPGALIFEGGKKTKSVLLSVLGFVVAALGQSYVVGAYAVFVVGLLIWFSEVRPSMPTWPLWIAAFFHSFAAPEYAKRERVKEPTAQHYSLGVVVLLSMAIFFIMVFAPNTLNPIYGWVPFYQSAIHPNTTSNNKNESDDVYSYSLTQSQREAVDGFFAAYQSLQDMYVLIQAMPNSQTPVDDLKRFEALIDKSLDRLTECEIMVLNDIQTGWGDIVKDKLMPALTQMKSGIQDNGNKVNFARSDALLASFNSWLGANWNEIGQKVGDK